MTKTTTEVIERAMRRLRVLASDEALTSEDRANAAAVLGVLVEELAHENDIHLMMDSFDDEVFIPLADLLAVEMAPEFNKTPPIPRRRAFSRLAAVARPDDRDLPVSASEEAAAERSKFY